MCLNQNLMPRALPLLRLLSFVSKSEGKGSSCSSLWDEQDHWEAKPEIEAEALLSNWESLPTHLKPFLQGDKPQKEGFLAFEKCLPNTILVPYPSCLLGTDPQNWQAPDFPRRLKPLQSSREGAALPKQAPKQTTETVFLIWWKVPCPFKARRLGCRQSLGSLPAAPSLCLVLAALQVSLQTFPPQFALYDHYCDAVCWKSCYRGLENFRVNRGGVWRSLSWRKKQGY